MLTPMSCTGLAHNISVFPGLHYHLFVVSKLHVVAYSQIYYILMTTDTSYHSEARTSYCVRYSSHSVVRARLVFVCARVCMHACVCLAVFIESVCGDRQVRQPCPIEQQRRRHEKKKPDQQSSVVSINSWPFFPPVLTLSCLLSMLVNTDRYKRRITRTSYCQQL